MRVTHTEAGTYINILYCVFLGPTHSPFDMEVFGMSIRWRFCSLFFYLIFSFVSVFHRLFGFHTLYNELKLVGKYSFHDRCILKVSLIQTESLRHVALTMATDGKVALWDLTTCVEELLGSEHSNNSCATSTSKNDSRPIVVDNLRPFSFVKIHQSGINSFDWLHLQGDKYLLATGGDDRALVLSLIQIVSPTPQESMHAEVVLQWRDDYAHASQITGEWHCIFLQVLGLPGTAIHFRV
jgi:WD40 repeat protein